MSMNEQLKELYQKYWDKTRDEIVIGKHSAFPFMISVSKRYEDAKKRVMFCGQETNDWNGQEYDSVQGSTVDSVMNRYDLFVNNGGDNRTYWNLQKRIIENNPEIGFVHNNIVKIGKRYGKGCDEDIDSLAHKDFPTFKKELDILKPNLIIFLTGPDYDGKIKYNLGSFNKENCLDIEVFSFLNHPSCLYFDKLTFSDSSVPLSYRINHPLGIQHQRQYYPMIKAINLIIKQL